MNIDHYPYPEIGMSVFVKPNHMEPYPAIITKVGRIWVTLNNNLRFDKSTWRVMGYYSSEGTVYPTELEYTNRVEKNEAFRQLTSKLRFKATLDDVTVEVYVRPRNYWA